MFLCHVVITPMLWIEYLLQLLVARERFRESYINHHLECTEIPNIAESNVIYRKFP